MSAQKKKVSVNREPWVAKWLVTPLALAVAGYFLIGPHLGKELFGPKGIISMPPHKVPSATPKPHEPTNSAEPGGATENEVPASRDAEESTRRAAESKAHTSGPDVAISVRPAGSEDKPADVVAQTEPPLKRRHHHKKRAVTVTPPADPSEIPPVREPTDEGSAGGLADNRG